MNDPRNPKGNPGQQQLSGPELKNIKVAIDALTSEVKAQRDEQKAGKKEQQKWPRRTAVAGIIYTFVTAVILLVTAYQAYLTRSNNVVSQRAFIFPTLISPNLAVLDPQDNNKVNAINFIYQLNNGGNTPTKELSFFLKCAPSAEDLIEPWSVLYQGPGQFERATQYVAHIVSKRLFVASPMNRSFRSQPENYLVLS